MKNTAASDTNRMTGVWMLTLATVAAGSGLRLGYYLANVALFRDETMLVSSIVNRSVSGLLLRPLDYGQTAPPLFLLFTKLGGFLSGYTQYGLRVPALLSGIAFLCVFAFLARSVLSGFAVPFAVCLLALSGNLIRIAGEVKQYSTDTFVSVVLTLYALKLVKSEYDARRVIAAGAIGICAVMASQPAVIMLAGLGAGLCLLALSSGDKQKIKTALSVTALWAGIALLATLFAFHSLEHKDLAFFKDYWQNSFMPFPPKSLADLVWPLRILRGVYWNVLNLPFLATGALLVSIWGMISLWRRGRRDAVTLLLLPMAVTIVLSLARAYPFTGKPIFFLVPALAIALGEGITAAIELTPHRVRRAAPLIFLLFLLPDIASVVYHFLHGLTRS